MDSKEERYIHFEICLNIYQTVWTYQSNTYKCTDGLCKIDGCEKQSRNNGVCVKHGAISPQCKIDGCENKQKKNGVCVTHGATVSRCKIDGCENGSVKEGEPPAWSSSVRLTAEVFRQTK